jgi:pimeloyl-ACP methyl ester carboxylesterase
MDAAERSAAARAAGAATGEVAVVAEAVHAAIGRGVAGALARAAAVPLRRADLDPGPGVAATVGFAASIPGTLARGWYAAVRKGAPAVGGAAGAALEATTPEGSEPWAEGPRGTATLAWLGAAFGDHLAASSGTSALAPAMAVRVDGRAVLVSDLAAAFPGADGDVCVFVHGLGGHERQWTGAMLDAAAAEGFTPVVVRYTTGLPMAANGRLLADLLDRLIAGWPAPVERLVVVGHSMGGLVARSAAAQAVGPDGAPHRWPLLLTDLVTLGSPHAGAPLERVSHRALQVLHRFDTGRPFAAFGHRRSAGIKDLRFGALLDEHWGGQHPDDVGADRASDATAPVPLPRGTQHVAVVGTLAADPESRLGRAAGDGMVKPASAAGRPAPGERVVRVPLGGVGHMALLADPRAVAAVSDVLARRTLRGAAPE